MAYGLFAIANKNYTPNGSGRDWFFLGDQGYRNGRRRIENVPETRKPRPPSELAHAKAYLGVNRKTPAFPVLQRWRNVEAQKTYLDDLKRSPSAPISGVWRERQRKLLVTEASVLGSQVSRGNSEAHGVPCKHMYHSVPCFPPNRYSATAPS
eukprot:TRINITY_DN46364_c0_g1_i1.p1 TRINITY_DN46364_c0_g1~~TRINITY_DN46364_c0_g1_i1.p1  ORF type:complete len:152 (-),score=14.86 TRINITY_DN46364_c0_g1_i1:157-612(-)